MPELPLRCELYPKADRVFVVDMMFGYRLRWAPLGYVPGEDDWLDLNVLITQMWYDLWENRLVINDIITISNVSEDPKSWVVIYPTQRAEEEADKDVIYPIPETGPHNPWVPIPVNCDNGCVLRESSWVRSTVRMESRIRRLSEYVGTYLVRWGTRGGT